MVLKKIDLKISHGVRKLTQIHYLKKTKEKSEKRKEKKRINEKDLSKQ